MTYTSTDYESRLEGILIIRRGASIFIYKIWDSIYFLKFSALPLVDGPVFWNFYLFRWRRFSFFEIWSSSACGGSCFLKFLALQFLDVLVFWNLEFFRWWTVSFFEILSSSAGGGPCFLKDLSLPLVDGLVFWIFMLFNSLVVLFFEFLISSAGGDGSPFVSIISIKKASLIRFQISWSPFSLK